MASAALLTLIVLTPQVRRPTQAPSREGTARRATRTTLSRVRRVTARDIGKTAPRGREAPLLDLALVSNSGISLPYPRYIRKATALACPSQVRATSPVKRPRLWGSEVGAPVALICQYIDRHKERFGGLADLPGPVRLRHQDRPGHRATPHYGTLPTGAFEGSSPLTRGLLRGRGHDAVLRRIIPARAGFTVTRALGDHGTGDHLRSRGVYRARAASSAAVAGSSPLARGLLLGDEARVGGGGIIPARAGFTRPGCAGAPP